MENEKDFTIPSAVLSDLCSRFIINVPEEERTDLIRVFFQIEIAHWFYLDFYCDSSFSTISTSSCNQLTKSPNFGAITNCISPYNNSDNTSSSSNDESNDNIIKQQQNQLMKPCSIRTFAQNIFRHCSFLMQHTNQVDDILSKWKVFKHAVPTNGAIILDESMRNVLLVQGFWTKASWGFPKGKVVEDESEAHCAQREVFEETGYDISDKLKEDQYLEIQINDQTIRLYIITGVSKSENFEPRTRREIKDVKWFAIDELPVHRKDTRTKQTLGYSPNAFFMVIPFLKALKQWIFANTRDGHSINNSNNSGKLYNNNRPHSTINHQRHNRDHNGGSHNNHHHHHHHHGHHNGHRNQNSSMNNTHKQLSKSNENLSTLTNNSGSGKKSQSKSSGQNKQDFEQQRAQLVKQQSQYYQKMHQNEFAEFLSCKEAALATKANKQNSNSNNNHPKTPKDSNNNSMNHNNKNQFGTHSNSKFKPIHNANNKAKSNNNNSQHILGSNITILQASNNNKNLKQFQNNNTNPVQYSQQNKQAQRQALTLNLNEQIQKMNQAKKQLEFNGPECWINFKFDLNSLIQDLPIEL